MKTCSKCGLAKDESEFHRDNSRKDKCQRRCKVCDKTYRDSAEGKEIHRKASAKNRKLHPQKAKARSAVSHAIRDGRLHKEPCHCGETNIQGHHKDYSKPLDVEWLCKKHHID